MGHEITIGNSILHWQVGKVLTFMYVGFSGKPGNATYVGRYMASQAIIQQKCIILYYSGHHLGHSTITDKD